MSGKGKNHHEISFIVPCYNEQDIVGYTVPRLLSAFETHNYDLELVVVDNGSTDRTGEIIRELAAKYKRIVFNHVEVNQGYGHGVISSIECCNSKWIGIIPADGQVDAEDVVRLYEALITTDGMFIGKVRRRFRMDGMYRKVVSTAYNLFFRALWPTLASIDVNGSPKIMPADYMKAMNLRSKGWLLDPEMMIKGHNMGLKVLELNVFARMRGNGVSHVKVETCWEFLTNLLSFRFSRKWQKDFNAVAQIKVGGTAGASKISSVKDLRSAG